MVLKVYRFQKRAFLLTVHGVNWRQNRRNCRSGKTKINKMVLSTEYLVLIKVLHQKRLRQLMNNHTASLEITVNAHESMLSRKLVFWTNNWKHVIKYDLYVKFLRILAHNVQICAKFCYKISMMFAKYFEYYIIILGGAFFRGHAVC